jgi:hypothetical protein
VSNKALATWLAREIFVIGDDGSARRAVRLQYMTGTIQNERPGGGMIESSLASCLEHLLDRYAKRADLETRTDVDDDHVCGVCEGTQRGVCNCAATDNIASHPGFGKLTDAVIAEMRWTCSHGTAHERWIATAACGCDRPAITNL